MEFSIAGRPVGPAHPPYIIAELSANHGNDLERAKRIVRQAAEAGADGLKLQAYTAGSLTIDSPLPDFLIRKGSLWEDRRLYELYEEASTPYEWFPELFGLARELGLTPFASPFDLDAVEMLRGLDAAAYKIASFEAVDHELIAACARTGKPVIISTGMCSAEETDEALAVARAAGCRDVALLKCTSAYPAEADEANLLTIPEMARRYDAIIGVSDHTLGSIVSAAACALGACLVEKHVIDAREPPTADSAFSLTPDQLTRLVADCREAHAARGGIQFGPGEREKGSLTFRRSLYAVADIAAGETITRANVRSIRPGMGLAPKHLPEVLGRRAAAAIPMGSPMSWALLD